MNCKEKNFLSAVVYVENDEKDIESFLNMLTGELTANFEHYEIICVNNSSRDHSASVIREFAGAHAGSVISILNMSTSQTMEEAMNAGVDLAIGDFVMEFDSVYVDYEPELIMRVYRHSLEGYDIVSAGTSKSKIASRMFYSIFNRHANLQYDLHTERFRILSRRSINRIRTLSKTIPYRKATYANCGLKEDTILYDSKGISGRKKPNTRQQLDTAFDSLIIYTDLAYKVTIAISLFMMLITLAGSIYAIIVYILGKPVAGYTTTLLLMTASFFGVFAILTVILKYLSLIVKLIFVKQEYVIESVEKLNNEDQD